MMVDRSHPRFRWLAVIIFFAGVTTGCVTETVEVTRVKIMERRVIERILVTVEVTRVQQPSETPTSTRGARTPLSSGATLEASPSPSPPTATPTRYDTTPVPTWTNTNSSRQAGQRLLETLMSVEQTLLSLVQALNSDPLPMDGIISLYDALRNAPSTTIPDGDTTLQSIYARYRDQKDHALNQGADLYTHLSQLKSGQASQADLNSIHLALARDSSSASTSTIQALIRELGAFIATLP